MALVLRRWRLAAAAALVTVLKLLIERGVWKLVFRERPAITEPNAIVRGSTATTGASFVSGHVILSTGLAWAITPYLRGWWRLAPWVVVGLIAFARIYLGAHNPLDVVGGLALGFVAGGAANLIVGVPVHARRPSRCRRLSFGDDGQRSAAGDTHRPDPRTGVAVAVQPLLGAGGQSVNTADSRVELSLDVARTSALGPVQRARALERLRGRLVDGVLTVRSSAQRSQLQNREAARERLAAVLAKAIAPPPPARRPSKPSKSANERRIAEKKRRGQTKRLRRADED